MTEGVMVDGQMMTREDFEALIGLARRGAAEGYWCPLCEVTIGNGDMEHEADCILWRAEDVGKP